MAFGTWGADKKTTPKTIRYHFEPKADITAYELALILSWFGANNEPDGPMIGILHIPVDGHADAITPLGSAMRHLTALSGTE
jgi:hypothetical protein